MNSSHFISPLPIRGEFQPTATTKKPRIAVAIPCYRVKGHVLSVIEKIGPEVHCIYVVDDCCPENSGRYVEENCRDTRVQIIYNAVNQGVGGATLVGMQAAAAQDADVIVKIDGDGQMDPAHILSFTDVILAGEADYAKGNRFFEPEGVATMPTLRLLGNASLSFFTKLSTGYWQTFDPTNGYIAIHASLIDELPLQKIAKRYFFESDLLFRLALIGARVVDVPMRGHYGDETSGLKPLNEIPRFAISHLRNTYKRIVYNYFLRNFSVASVELVLGLIALVFGVVFGLFNWNHYRVATAGTVMLAALPIILGVQFLLAFLNYDIQSTPAQALHPRLRKSRRNISPVHNQNDATGKP
ncbi:glycosyltransferase family 2 protein [Aestuariivirga litoralis]|uniref:glycosyltransferase family 2 protein n=1 Tax=Aestuariivirga litoralis TaxID=2650924 RepID=UPI0018C559F0|nr:glycosyltransferase family 2 protein [Aestuariivirga litoralis]MBG1233590.1 glycosyltransferase family 2 protein [Aestuariivirga litoralis]